MSMSCQRYTADVARRICHSLDGLDFTRLDTDGSPRSHRLLDDHHEQGLGVDSDSSVAITAAEASRLRRMWRRQLIEDAGRTL